MTFWPWPGIPWFFPGHGIPAAPPPAANTAMLWRGNRWQCFAGDPETTWVYAGGPAAGPTNVSPAFQGSYWWPSDDNSHPADYTG
jgi:hypothetical protein